MRADRLKLAAVVGMVALAMVALWIGIMGKPPEAPGAAAPDDLTGWGEDSFLVSDVSFTIGGRLSGPLSPGETQPLDMSLHNKTTSALDVTRLTVIVQGVDAPNANAGHLCTVRDFTATQLDAAYPLTVPAQRTSSLSDLGVPRALWPSILILNTPGNQDGCKAATLALAYTGSAGGSQP